MSGSKKDFIKLVFGERAVEELSGSISEDWEIKEFFDLLFGEWKKEVSGRLEWKGIKIEWDPDSSPEAWEHYKKYYTPEHWELLDQYGGKGLADSDPLSVGKGGLYAPQIEIGCPYDKKCDKPCSAKKKDGQELLLRLRGETDFNFKEDQKRPKKDKYGKLKGILWRKPPKIDNYNLEEARDLAIELLNKCKEMHHSLLNFSLLQSVGAMQLFKGTGLDRPDTFIYYLDRYFEGKDKRILEKSRKNKDCLIQYLASFTDIYDYCEKVYFIKDDDFVQEMIESGGKKLLSGDDVVEYMKLAIEFWERKRRYFVKCR